MKRRNYFWIFWALMYAGVFLVLCQVGYSDGDDTYFNNYTHSMGFFSYLGWRYETWVGRLAGEALVYLTFHMGLWFWRAVNALMLVLLPLGLLKLSCKAAAVPEGSFWRWNEHRPVSDTGDYREYGLGFPIAAVSGYLLMHAMTLGYAAVWVNGSIFYTWTFTCGIYAMMPLADLVFCDRSKSSGGKQQDKGSLSTGESAVRDICGIRFNIRGTDWKRFLYSIPCCIIAAMSIEQMGAVLLVFEILGLLFCLYRSRSINVLMLIQTILTLAAFTALFLAPGNALRVAAETVTWMPEYNTMSTGQHLFITLQWLLSSFANENKLFLCAVWVAGILLLLQKKEQAKADFILGITAAVLTAVALLPYLGVTAFSDFGIHITDLTACVSVVPSMQDLSAAGYLPFIWWGASLVFTLFYVGRVSGGQITLVLVYLAGIASEAIMYFSPTMYASGGRVYYLTDLLYLFAALSLSLGIRHRNRRNMFYAILIGAGIFHFIFQLPLILQQL